MKWPSKSRPLLHTLLDEGHRMIAYSMSIKLGFSSTPKGEAELVAKDMVEKARDIVASMAEEAFGRHGSPLVAKEEIDAFHQDLAVQLHRKCLDILEGRHDL
jgi:hypothetical protein